MALKASIKHLVNTGSAGVFGREVLPLPWRMRSKIEFNGEKQLFKKYPSVPRLSRDSEKKAEVGGPFSLSPASEVSGPCWCSRSIPVG